MPKLTKEARERLVALHNVYANRDGAGPAQTADDIWTALAYIDALEGSLRVMDSGCDKQHERIDALEAESESRFAQVAAAGVRVLELEKRVAELERSEALRDLEAVAAVARAKNAESRVAVLAAECRAWRLAHEAASPAAFAGDMERIGHAEDAYELMHRSIDVMMEVTRAATDANGGLDA